MVIRGILTNWVIFLGFFQDFRKDIWAILTRSLYLWKGQAVETHLHRIEQNIEL